MANTYTQIHLHFIFAVKYRDRAISKTWENELYKYISGIIQNNGHKMLKINGVADHIHILIGMRPTQSISELLKDIKGSSSKWINENNFVTGSFSWQEGYGAFSYGKSQVREVIHYIENQKEHHKLKTFKEEYVDFLEKFEVEYDEKYIFQPLI